jgi:hypothetical protein
MHNVLDLFCVCEFAGANPGSTLLRQAAAQLTVDGRRL